MNIDVLNEIRHAHAHLGYGVQWHMMAEQIIKVTLGADWYSKNCAQNSKRIEPFDQDLNDDEMALEYHLNIVRLAHMIFLLRNSSGFEPLLLRLKSRDFEPVFFELHAASLLHQNGYAVNFISESGVKGCDYDFEVTVDGISVAVEVKARRAHPIRDCNTLLNALKTARKQVPSDKPTLICVALATEHFVDKSGHHSESEIEATLQAFLRSTSRVNGIIVFWHRWVGVPLRSETITKEYRNFDARNNLSRRWLIQPVKLSTRKDIQNGFPSFML